MSVFRRVTFACVLVAAVRYVWLCRRAKCEKIQSPRNNRRLSAATRGRVSAVRKDRGKGICELDPKDPKTRSSSICSLRRGTPGQSRILVRLLYSQADGPQQGQSQDVVRAAESRKENDQRSQPWCGGNDPGSVTDASLLGNSFLMPQGYSISFSGWDFSAKRMDPISARPHAADREESRWLLDHRSVLEYIVTRTSYALTYPAATLDRSKATLTHRVHLNDALRYS